PRAPCHRRDRPIRRPGPRGARGAGGRRHRHCLAERPESCPGRPDRHDARHEGPGVPGRRRHRRGAGPGPGTGRRHPGNRGPPRVRPGPAAGTLRPIRRLHQGPGPPPRLRHRRAEPVPASRRGRAGPAPSRASFAVRSTPVLHDQAFPDRPVRIIDPFGAGGGVDVIARALASRLAAAWGQPAIVENHPGAGSTAAPALVAHAPPDGYTLLINTSAQAYSAARAGELPYDPLRDFVPVAALTSQPYVLVAGAQSGITTIDELAAAASDRPGEIRFASAGTGTGTHLAVAKLNRDLGIAAVHTPPAATDAITDVIAGTAAGHTTYAMLPIPPAAPYLHHGPLAALGVSPARRSRLLPDVPPLTNAGVAGFDFPIWYGIWAPARTPAGIISTLARDIADTLATAELSQWLTQHDADPMHMSPAEFGAFVVSEAERAAVLLSTP